MKGRMSTDKNSDSDERNGDESETDGDDQGMDGPDRDETDQTESPLDDDEVPIQREGSARDELKKHRERLEEEADRAVEGFDQGIIDLLAWLLDTETRARIYVYLRQQPNSTSEEIAEGTGLYPSTVREALAELHEEETVQRQKRESEGAGNNPYEYEAIAPSDLVGTVVHQIQDELNTVFNLDRYLGGSAQEPETEPVTITVEDARPDDSTREDDADDGPWDAADADHTERDVRDDVDEGDEESLDDDASNGDE